MILSKETTAAIVDLIENKLAMMHIADCDDLREKITMQRALSELRGAGWIRPNDRVVIFNTGTGLKYR